MLPCVVRSSLLYVCIKVGGNWVWPCGYWVRLTLLVLECLLELFIDRWFTWTTFNSDLQATQLKWQVG